MPDLIRHPPSLQRSAKARRPWIKSRVTAFLAALLLAAPATAALTPAEQRMAAAVTAVREGARFVATNADARYPTTAGFLPGAGSGVAAIRAATGVEPLVVGKPQPAMFEAILAADGIGPADALVVGDNPAADIVAARRAGIRSVLVLTGIADDERAAGLIGDERPDALLPGIADLPAWLGLA